MNRARRRLLVGPAAALGAWALAPRTAAQPANPPSTPPRSPPGSSPTGHGPFGPVRPARRPPDLALIDAEGRRLGLRSLLAGRPTALQLMFTGCSATCPIQGAVFAESARRLRTQALAERVRLVSFSIDALGDTPAALQRWMQRHGPDPMWQSVVPTTPAGVDAMFDFLQVDRSGPDPHTTQVQVFDRRGLWVFKSADLPSSREVADWLARSA